MQKLTREEIRNELLNLDSSNGWGVEFKPGIYIAQKDLIAEIELLVEEYNAFPVNQTLESDYDSIIVKCDDGTYTFGICQEASMLNYQKSEESGDTLHSYATQIASYFFKDHLNKIQVLKWLTESNQSKQ